MFSPPLFEAQLRKLLHAFVRLEYFCHLGYQHRKEQHVERWKRLQNGKSTPVGNVERLSTLHLEVGEVTKIATSARFAPRGRLQIRQTTPLCGHVSGSTCEVKQGPAFSVRTKKSLHPYLICVSKVSTVTGIRRVAVAIPIRVIVVELSCFFACQKCQQSLGSGGQRSPSS